MEIVKNREASRATVCGITESDTVSDWAATALFNLGTEDERK